MRTHRLFAFVFALCLLLPVAGWSQIEITNNITSNTTWTSGNVYWVKGYFTVEPGVTLTIQPGVVVKFNNYYFGLEVKGTLNAVGTAASPVVFTSYADDTYGGDTNGDGSASQPGRGNWAGIDFQPGSSGQLTYCRLTYGGGALPLVRTYSDNVSVTNCFLGESGSRGIQALDASPDLHSNVFSGISLVGVRIDGFSAAKDFNFTNNTFDGNQQGAVQAVLDNETVSINLSGNTSTASRYGGFGIQGTIAGQVTFTGQDNFPFILGNTVTVNAGASLDVPFGTVFKADNYYFLLDVYGTLRAQGSPQAPVVFTSYFNDAFGGDTNNDADASAPNPGNWSGIRFNAGSAGILDWCHVSYGGGSIGSNVYTATDALTISNSDILFSGTHGIGIVDASPDIEYNLIGFNNIHGISINGFSQKLFDLTGNDFQSNRSFAVHATLSEETNNISLNGNTYSGGPSSVFRIGGTITGQVTYQGQSDFAFMIDESSVSVEPQARLVVTPGTVIKFLSYYSRILVKAGAQLYADGTTADSIVFTSFLDDDYAGDSNSDGNASLPAGSNWGGVDFLEGSAGSMSYCRVRYGGGTIPLVRTYTGDLALMHCYFSNSGSIGVRVHNASPDINSNTFFDIRDQGVHIQGFATGKDFVFTNNTFRNVGGGAVWAGLEDETINITLNGNLAEASPHGGFGLQGTIAGQVTYTGQDNFPFILWNTVTVDSGASLEVPFGTTFKAENYYFLIDVHGTFRALGSPQAPVVFTSYFNDAQGGDTNNDGDASNPTPGNWSGIRFNAGSQGALDWCHVSYAGGSLGSNVVIASDDVRVTNSDIFFSGAQGIAIVDASPDIEYNLIGFNRDRGVSINGFSAGKPFTMMANDFQDNGQWAVFATLSDETNDITLQGNTVSSGQRRGFGLAGTIAGTVTYNGQRDFPFLITEQTLNVKSGASLTIQQGTTVKFIGYFSRLDVNGQFHSLGTSGHPVFYTSYLDDALGGDTNGDSSATAPAVSNWGGIFYQAGSQGQMNYSCLNYGAGTGGQLLFIGSDDVTVFNCAFGNTSGRGVIIDGAGPTITKSIFHKNAIGVYTRNGADPTLESCEFLDNRDWGLYNADGAAQVFAINNWWGSVTGPDHPSNVSAGEGDKVSDNVVFEPWLDHVSGQDLIPIPVIGLTPYGYAVALSNDSYTGSDFEWDFGDGTTSTLDNPYHTYAEPGNYEIKLTGTSLCHVIMTQNVIIGVKGVKSFSPTTGGNIGTVTVEVAGGGFTQNTQVALVQSGGAQLPAQEVIIQDGENLVATFNTEMQPLGDWKILLTYAGGSQVLSDEFFVMQPGVKGDPWLQVSGHSATLFNTWQTYNITYGNAGNVDVYGVNLWLALSDLPDLEVEFLNVDFELNAYALDMGYDFIRDVDPWVYLDSVDGLANPTRVIPLYIPMIPAGEEYTIKVRIRSKEAFNLEAWLNDPYFSSPFNGRLAGCVTSVITEALIDIVPGVDCARTVIKSIYKPQNAYRAGSKKVFAMPGMWDMVNIGIDCGLELGGAIGFAKDIIGLVMNIRQYKADIDDCVKNFDKKDPKKQQINIFQSYDPNEKVGPVGYEASNYIPYQEEVQYTIFFENKEDATAPAHRVIIRDTLDPDVFDLASIELEEVVIADSVFTAFTRARTYANQVELPHLGVTVRITGEVDTNGILVWEFVSLDPVTLDVIEDPFIGFLPPNVSRPEGEGNVRFTIGLKSTPSEGMVVHNKASIYFDGNDQIETNAFVNTFDLLPPETTVGVDAEETSDTLVELKLTGMDMLSGIDYYQIWYAANTDTFRLLAETGESTYTFDAEPGNSYHFYTVGVDRVGNREMAPNVPDVTVNVLVATDELQSPVDFLQIQPNPARVRVEVRFRTLQEGNLNLLLYSPTGELVRQRLIPDHFGGIVTEVIDLGDLPAGLYMIGLQMGEKRAYRRLVVQ